MGVTDHRVAVRRMFAVLPLLVVTLAPRLHAEPPLPTPSLRAEAIAGDMTRVLDGEWQGFFEHYGRQCLVRCTPRISREGKEPVWISWPPQMPGSVSAMAVPNPDLARVDWAYCEIRMGSADPALFALDRYGVLVWRVGEGAVQSEFIGWGRGDFADSSGNLAGAVEKALVRLLSTR